MHESDLPDSGVPADTESDPSIPSTASTAEPATRAERRTAEREAATGSTPVARARGGVAAGFATATAGIMSAIRKHPTAWIAAGGAAALIVLGTGSVALGATVGSPAAAAVAPSPTASAAKTPTPTPTPTVDPARPVPAAAPAAVRLRTCSVAGLARDGRRRNLEAPAVTP